MRKQWFGDSRDYVKWSFISSEAQPDSAVCYIAMARPDELPDTVAPEVLALFQKYKHLDLIGELFPGRYVSLQTQYENALHSAYFDEVLDLLHSVQTNQSVIVFIDPDTGIEPRGAATNKHIRLEDIRRVATSLRTKDKLIIYQHAPIMRKPNWMESAANRLEEQSWFEDFRLRRHHDQACASDVCFLVIETKL